MTADNPELWAKYRANRSDVAARNRLVEAYLPLVRGIAERLKQSLPDAVEVDDLVSVGVIGLMEAIASFDVDRGYRFATYSLARIRGAMLDELRNQDDFPRLVRSRAKEITEASRALEDCYGRKPTEEEIAEQLDISPEELQRRRVAVPSVGSLAHVRFEIDTGRVVTLGHVLVDVRAESPGERDDRRERLVEFTRGLNRTERLVVILYYYERLTMREIGRTLELSESRVSQLHSHIIARLRARIDVDARAEISPRPTRFAIPSRFRPDLE